MRTMLRWILATGLLAIILGIPALMYRAEYVNQKRFREVTRGKFYRSGQFTASGLKDMVRDYKIKSVINLQEENADPFMPEEFLTKPYVRESELCQQLGVRYYALFGGQDVSDAEANQGLRAGVIDEYLKILDDPKNYPVLIHCKAGLHRTGRLTAIYRLEYENWTMAAAMQELRANGYGTFMASEADAYIVHYLGHYRKGVRHPGPTPRFLGGP
ncbi:MAG: fused DSP-PTPase phosphatase/NAD kinase-like protein [Gemmataceae bacterium]